MEKSEAKPKELDEFLKEVGMGKWQMLQALLLLFPAMCLMFPISEYIFAAGQIPYRCLVPECEGGMDMLIYEPDWISHAVPLTKGIMDRCLRFLPRVDSGLNGTGDNCPAYNFDTTKTISCDSYVYNRTNTMVYDFSLECQEWKRVLIGTANSLGALFAMSVTGYISDKFGRRFALVISALNIAIIAIIRSFSVNYEMYIILQFAGAAFGAGLFSAIFIMASEMVPPYMRVRIAFFLSVCVSCGQMIAGLIAWALPQWRVMIRVSFIPQLLFIVYFWIMAESVRWLLSNEKYEQAAGTMHQIIKWNSSNVADSTIESIIDGARSKNDELKIQAKIDAKKATDNEPMLVFLVLKSPEMTKRMLVLPIWWITHTLVYYGLSINAVNLAGNIYLNYILAGAVEIPGYIIGYFLLDGLGRKFTLCMAYFVCSMCTLTFPFIPSDLTWLKLITFLVGKSAVGMVVLACYTFTAELLPTKHRHSLLAFTSMVGRIGSITAPLTPALAMYWHGIPSLIFGAMCLLSGLLTLTMPDTVGLILPDTIAEAENIGRPKVDETFKMNDFTTEFKT